MSLATKDSQFSFDGIFCKQIDGMARGSSLGPILNNTFSVYHKKKWLERCPLKYRPLYYQKYTDDIFVLFNSPEDLNLFRVT